MKPTKINGTSAVLSDIIRAEAALGQDLAALFDRMNAPVVATRGAEAGEGQTIAYCNDAFCELTGFARGELRDTPLQRVYSDGVEPEALRRFFQGLRRDGFARILLTVSGKAVRAQRADVCGVCLEPPTTLGAGRMFVLIFRPLQQAELIPSDAPVPDAYRLAMLVETLLRRYIRQNYRQGMHPAQWSALRFFRLAPPEQRTLTSFAKAHHTTMGTASTTVSTLVGKGYLKKHGFRGPIEITPSGERVLQQDPLGAVAEVLAAVSEDERGSARQTLSLLVEGLDDERD